jgi:hypothetical protein
MVDQAIEEIWRWLLSLPGLAGSAKEDCRLATAQELFQPLIRLYRDGRWKSIPGRNDHYSDLMSTLRLSGPQLQGALDSRPVNEGGKRVFA